eukprot:scaffold52362_cov39-Prasinocladus_malaysianus.AAC.2
MRESVTAVRARDGSVHHALSGVRGTRTATTSDYSSSCVYRTSSALLVLESGELIPKRASHARSWACLPTGSSEITNQDSRRDPIISIFLLLVLVFVAISHCTADITLPYSPDQITVLKLSCE